MKQNKRANFSRDSAVFVKNVATRQHGLRISVGTLTMSIEIIDCDMIYGLFHSMREVVD
jgi:hypothetical protein